MIPVILKASAYRKDIGAALQALLQMADLQMSPMQSVLVDEEVVGACASRRRYAPPQHERRFILRSERGSTFVLRSERGSTFVLRSEGGSTFALRSERGSTFALRSAQSARLEGRSEDHKYLEEEKSSQHEGSPAHELVSLETWLDEKNQINRPSVATLAQSLSTHDILILDATSLEAEIISTNLKTLASIWFHVPIWPKAFVLVVDDYYATQFLSELMTTFYITTLPHAVPNIQAEIRSFRLRIRVLRWFGFGPIARFLRYAHIFVSKAKYYVKRRLS